MSEEHGGKVLQVPVGEYAAYMRMLLPVNIPETYPLKPMFDSVADGADIRRGVVAFRDFLHVLCDRLTSDGHHYSTQQMTKNAAEYQFLTHLNRLLIDIGYYGALSENGDTLLVGEIPSFTSAKQKIPLSKQMECMRFLTLCGFNFPNLDADAKMFAILDGGPLAVSYPNAPILLTGLKALSIAAMGLWVRFYNNADSLFRCDYRVLSEEDADIGEVLKDLLYSLPDELQQLAMRLHRRYIDKGMTCITLNDNMVHFAYARVSKGGKALSVRDIYQRRVWELALSFKYGFCIFVRAKKTDKYAEAIKNFDPSLQQRILQGYGCDRKLRGEPCQGGCQGIRIPLDDTALSIEADIAAWLDLEAL